jgi:DNA-binding MarR family transcriptional regulator
VDRSPEPRWLNDDEQRAWRAFIDAVRLFTGEIDRALQHDSGLNHAYYQILVALSEAPDRTMRMSELAALTLTSRSRLSHAVARLEEAGWVARRSCPSDKRGSFAVMTDEGFTVLEAAARGHVEVVRRNLFDVLSAGQVQQLGEISAVLRGALRAGTMARGDGADEPAEGMTAVYIDAVDGNNLAIGVMSPCKEEHDGSDLHPSRPTV